MGNRSKRPRSIKTEKVLAAIVRDIQAQNVTVEGHHQLIWALLDCVGFDAVAGALKKRYGEKAIDLERS